MTGIHLFDSSKETQQVDAGTVLFKAGEPGDHMYAVVQGEIDILKSGSTIETVTAGGIIGEMALLDDAPRGGTAVVRSDATLVPVSRDRFVHLIQEHPTFALQVMGIMAQRLRNQSH